MWKKSLSTQQRSSGIETSLLSKTGRQWVKGTFVFTTEGKISWRKTKGGDTGGRIHGKKPSLGLSGKGWWGGGGECGGGGGGKLG